MRIGFKVFFGEFSPIVTVANFNSRALSLDLVEVFGSSAASYDYVKVLLSTTQFHEMNGLYNAHSFDLGPYESVIFQFEVPEP